MENANQETPYSPEISNGADILECLNRALPYFHKMIPLDNMIALSDTEKYLNSVESEKTRMPFNVIGMPLPPGDALAEAVRTGQHTVMTVPAEVFGFSFKGFSFPVKDDNGKIIGGIGLAFNLETQNLLTDTAQSLSASSQEVTATTEELSAAAMKLAQELEGIKSRGERVLEEIKKPMKFLSLLMI